MTVRFVSGLTTIVGRMSHIEDGRQDQIVDNVHRLTSRFNKSRNLFSTASLMCAQSTLFDEASTKSQQAVRLAKFWIALCCPTEPKIRRQDDIISYIAIDASKKSKAGNLAAAFKTFLFNLTHFDLIEIDETLKGLSSWGQSSVKPRIIDPGNPYDNLLEGEDLSSREKIATFLQICRERAGCALRVMNRTAGRDSRVCLADAFLLDHVLDYHQIENSFYVKVENCPMVYFAKLVKTSNTSINENLAQKLFRLVPLLIRILQVQSVLEDSETEMTELVEHYFEDKLNWPRCPSYVSGVPFLEIQVPESVMAIKVQLYLKKKNVDLLVEHLSIEPNFETFLKIEAQRLFRTIKKISYNFVKEVSLLRLDYNLHCNFETKFDFVVYFKSETCVSLDGIHHQRIKLLRTWMKYLQRNLDREARLSVSGKRWIISYSYGFQFNLSVAFLLNESCPVGAARCHRCVSLGFETDKINSSDLVFKTIESYYLSFMSENKLFSYPMIRFCKFWMKVCCPESKQIPNMSMIVEMIVAKASNTSRKSWSSLAVFQTFLELLINYHELNIDFNWSAVVANEILTEPKIIHPKNKHCNLLKAPEKSMQKKIDNFLKTCRERALMAKDRLECRKHSEKLSDLAECFLIDQWFKIHGLQNAVPQPHRILKLNLHKTSNIDRLQTRPNLRLKCETPRKIANLLKFACYFIPREIDYKARSDEDIIQDVKMIFNTYFNFGFEKAFPENCAQYSVQFHFRDRLIVLGSCVPSNAISLDSLALPGSIKQRIISKYELLKDLGLFTDIAVILIFPTLTALLFCLTNNFYPLLIFSICFGFLWFLSSDFFIALFIEEKQTLKITDVLDQL